MQLTYFVSGDVHSFYENWRMSLSNAGFDIDNPSHIVIVCGDLFDRGSSAQDCFIFVKELAAENRLIYIRGNHEDLLFECVKQFRKGYTHVDAHHYTNGTVSTVAQLTGISIYNLLSGCYTLDEFNKIDEVLEFIEQHAVNYAELSDYIFVHGWVPCESRDNRKYNGMKIVTLANRETWNDDKWEYARWLNGMHCWSQGAVPESKTVVCGHWNTSWGNCRFHHVVPEEFPPISRKNAIKAFKPFVDDGIIALDGSTAYSGLVNVAVFTVEDDGSVSVSNID